MRKPIQEWSRDEMEKWVIETHIPVISEDGTIENKMSMDIDAPQLTPEQESEWEQIKKAFGLDKLEKELKEKKRKG